MELRVPQDRQGRFSTQLFERYKRSEKAFVGALVEMYEQGVSTRKIKAITEELCGHEFSASAVSDLNVKLDAELERFARRSLEMELPYLILDARYEKVREEGVIRSRAVLLAIGIDWDGRRQILAAEIAGRESTTSWRELLLSLKQRGLRGVRCTVSDDHPGLKRSVAEVLPESCWQRCYVHFLRNALDHLPRKADDDCLTELRWLYDRRDGTEARQHLAAWIERWQDKYPKLTSWVEEQIEDSSGTRKPAPRMRCSPQGKRGGAWQTFTFYRLPQSHHKHLKSTNLLERFNQELSAAPRSCASSQTTPVACASSVPLLPSSTRNGSMALATSTCSHSLTFTKPNSNSPLKSSPRTKPNSTPSLPIDSPFLLNLTDTTCYRK
jgi:putative transposase